MKKSTRSTGSHTRGLNAAWTRILLGLRRLGRQRVKAVLLMGLVGLLGSSSLGLIRGIPLPRVHDEFSYLLGADTFSEGRLTNPTHPHWQHFETFHVIHQPTYQSKYPPAQALALGAAQRFAGHAVVALWIGAGVLAASLTWALLIWLPSHWGLLAGVLGTMHLTWFTYWSHSYWGGAIAAIGGALCIGAFRLIWSRPRAWHGVILGSGLVIMALSRPFEGALLGLLVSSALLYRMVGSNQGLRFSVLAKGLLPATLVVAAGLGWQGYYNSAVTGSPLTMPYQVDRDQYAAAPSLLLSTPGTPPAYRHAIMEEFWMEWGRERHLRQRELSGILTNVPKKIGLLIVFFLGPGVLAFIGLGRAPARSWMAFSGVGLLFVVGAALLTKASHPHYVAPATALFFVLVGAGLAGLHRRSRSMRRIDLSAAIATGFAILALTSIMTLGAKEPHRFASERATLLNELEASSADHLIFVTYGDRHHWSEEWVYNRADIDASRVVWARTMTPDQDEELIAYFEGRTVWLLTVDGTTRLQPHPAVRNGGDIPVQ